MHENSEKEDRHIDEVMTEQAKVKDVQKCLTEILEKCGEYDVESVSEVGHLKLGKIKRKLFIDNKNKKVYFLESLY